MFVFRADPAQGEPGLSPAEKKRKRDRRAQHNLRQKRLGHINELEQQVAFCKERHGITSVESLVERVRQLELDNQTLRNQSQKMLQRARCAEYILSRISGLSDESLASDCMVSAKDGPSTSMVNTTLQGLPDPSCSPFNVPSFDRQPGRGTLNLENLGSMPSVLSQSQGSDVQASYSSPSPDVTVLDDGSRIRQAQTPIRLEGVNYPPTTTSNEPCSHHSLRRIVDPTQQTIYKTGTSCAFPHLGVHQKSRPVDQVGNNAMPKPRWNLLPNSITNSPWAINISPWLRHPEAIMSAPRHPKPIDLLYGSRTNFLANEIHKTMRNSLVAETERLASGWLVYVYTRWRACPTKENFDLVPSFMWPLTEELDQDHDQSLDLVYWPALRRNLIDQSKQDNLPCELNRLWDALSCCVKVRWPWGEEILEHNNDDDTLQIRPKFMDTFTRIEGWGLTSYFIDKFRPLLEGIDISTIAFIIT